MKAARGQIERALDRPGADVRLFLLYGPDDSGSRALGDRLAKAMGANAERVDLAPAQLKADPALLADEAASISLFGDPRYIRVEGIGDESLDAVAALIEAPVAGNPVLLIAGALRKDAKLLKLALAVPAALVFASYLPEGQEADRMIGALAADLGLRVRPEVARRLAASSGGDRALAARELEKFALYLDAAPEHPQELDIDSYELLGVEGVDGDLSRLVDAVMGGGLRGTGDELSRLAAEGIEGIPLIRAVLRRTLQLAQLQGDADGARGPEAVMATAGKAIFWKDKDAITRQLGRWPAPDLARAVTRLVESELAVKASGTAGTVAAAEDLVAISRAASRWR